MKGKRMELVERAKSAEIPCANTKCKYWNNLFSQNQVQKAEEIKSSGKVEEAFLTCNQCGATFSPSAKFCPQCGDPTDDEKKGKVKYCPNCGAQASPTAKFCGACGFKLK